MTPEQAAICLRDDPTFATSSREDQETEATLLLGDDDPLAVALAIELALDVGPRSGDAAGGVGDEGCRLEKPCAAPAVAGNGRCGARLFKPAPFVAHAACGVATAWPHVKGKLDRERHGQGIVVP